MQVSLSELLAILDSHKGALIVTMVTRTNPKLLAKSRATGQATVERFPQGIERMAYGRFLLGTNYEANVQAQREREGHDDPQGFAVEGLWKSQAHPEGAGRHLGRFLVVHVDKPGVFYFRCRPQSDEQGMPLKIRSELINPDTGDEIVGDDLDDLIHNYMPARGPAKKQEVAREIPYRAYEVGGIVSLTVGGITYELDHDGETPEWVVPEVANA